MLESNPGLLIPSPCFYLTLFSSCPRVWWPNAWVSYKYLKSPDHRATSYMHSSNNTDWASSKWTWTLWIQWLPWAGLIPIIWGDLRGGHVGQHQEGHCIFQGQDSGPHPELLKSFMLRKDITGCAFQRDGCENSVGLGLERKEVGVKKDSSRRLPQQFKGEIMSPALLATYPEGRTIKVHPKPSGPLLSAALFINASNWK